MKSNAAAAEDALKSLDSAIIAALKGGAGEEDVYRAINAAYKKRTGRILDFPRDSKSVCLSNRVFLLALLFCAIVISVFHTTTFRGQEYLQTITFESNYSPQTELKGKTLGGDFATQKAMGNNNGLRKPTQTMEEEEGLSRSSFGVPKSMKYTKALQNQTQTRGDNFGVLQRTIQRTNKTYTKKSYTKIGKAEEDNSPRLKIKMRSIDLMRNQTQTEAEEEESFSGRNSTIQRWIGEYNLEAISQLLQYAPANISMTMNKTVNPCPLDAFFHDDCQKRSGGTVCIFPGAILKKVANNKVRPELDSFKVLNDTRFFPELYYQNYECKTVLEENVRPPGLKGSRWCANFTYYRKFYQSAFEIFTANNIIALDLNTCCNTIVKNDYIRIIDFGKYILNQPPDEVLSENKMILEEILDSIPDEIATSKRRGYCE